MRYNDVVKGRKFWVGGQQQVFILCNMISKRKGAHGWKPSDSKRKRYRMIPKLGPKYPIAVGGNQCHRKKGSKK